eukprot:TRINITY_DN17517_c0_g1_i2.p1 TRINITY_DN17517_c0_g1~~TRINITY_DN17517_c0_g1_i2.p1  ORF type:complete len:422 (-),score=72.07 TRINITY_DN17517_c0_g1_i2:132-1397(-)
MDELIDAAYPKREERGKKARKKRKAPDDRTEAVPIYLTRNISACVAMAKMTPACHDRNRRCLEAIKELCWREMPRWRVRAFGSYSNGFGTARSGLDVTLCEIGRSFTDEQQQAVDALTPRILLALSKHPLIAIDDVILTGRTPLLKLCFANELVVNLSCHTPSRLLNTFLLRSYSRLDPRVREFGVAVRLWASGCNLCGADTPMLSSYVITLLVIYFLQVHPDAKLPVIPVAALKVDEDRFTIDFVDGFENPSWECKLSLSQLFVRFFDFYSNGDCNGFVWGSEVVSIRLGSRHSSDSPVFKELCCMRKEGLHVEDPFNLDHNLSDALGIVEEAFLRRAFANAAADMHKQRADSGFSSERRAEPEQSPKPVIQPTSFSLPKSWQRGTAAMSYSKALRSLDSRLCANVCAVMCAVMWLLMHV